MSAAASILLYGPEDRPSVREIAYETADRGNPADNIFSDRQVLGDLLTIYYTDYEPGSLWVAESDGKVVGYLSGCLDTRRYFRLMAFVILPLVLIKAIFCGVFFRKSTWRLLKPALKSWRRGDFKRQIPLDKYPAHLHIDIKKEFRGQKIGQRLVEGFIGQLQQERIPGIHLSTHEDNTPAQKFFERQGFKEFNRYPTINPDAKDDRIKHAIVYVRGS